MFLWKAHHFRGLSFPGEAFTKQQKPIDVYPTTANTVCFCEWSEKQPRTSRRKSALMTHFCVNTVCVSVCMCVWGSRIVVQWAFFGGFIDNTWAHLRQRKRERGKIPSWVLPSRQTGRGGSSTQLQTFFFLVKLFNWAIENVNYSAAAPCYPEDLRLMSVGFRAQLQRLFKQVFTHLLSLLCRATGRVENRTPRSFWLCWGSWPSRSPGNSRGEGTTRTPWILRLFSVCWHSLQWTRIHRYPQHCLGPAWYYIR